MDFFNFHGVYIVHVLISHISAMASVIRKILCIHEHVDFLRFHDLLPAGFAQIEKKKIGILKPYRL